MEELKNCKLCGKLFQGSESATACPSCIENDENDFEMIREYLYKHPLASVYEVATNLELTVNKIKHYLREGRIEIVDKNNQFLTCKNCGKPIHTGWFCEECMKQPSHDPKTGFAANTAAKSGLSGNPAASSTGGSPAKDPAKKVTSIKFHQTDKK